MLVPVVGGSDKTTVSVATGNQEFHPVYDSPGNLTNSARRGHGRGVLPVAFLPIPKGIVGNHLVNMPALTLSVLQQANYSEKTLYFKKLVNSYIMLASRSNFLHFNPTWNPQLLCVALMATSKR